jgi:hypothetical protein
MQPVRRTPGTAEQTQPVPNHPTVEAAARNNAEWCAAVCASHDVPSSFGTDAWAAHARAPMRYPDAVALEPFTNAGQLLPRIDAGPGCSIKDSFATLEGLPPGFRVLFEAEWIGREAPTAGDHGSWAPVGDTVELHAWETAWAGGEPPSATFRPALFEQPTVVFMAGRIGRTITSGAVLNHNANVVGISNLFATDTDLDTAWASAIAAAGTQFPNTPLVGYERGDDLAAALRNGFVALGPLRVWVNDAQRAAATMSSTTA